MTDIGEIRPAPLAEALGERYLSYALSTIMSRSLPDVRDGLKPVHRRLLYAMRQLRLNPGQTPKKSARVVGDVIGKYHPHGDTAVYDALVRLAQDFAARWPLVDGQGNFGNIDGDNAAAMRYTEARLTAVAEALLVGIDEDTVDFRATYDGEGAEPVVLPARFPHLLANGASGIAVGMATAIPPHNVGELCDALTHLLHHPDCVLEDLLRFVPGPDFPTGGLLVESPESIREAYATGRGGFRIRARWAVEKLKGGTWQVVVTEIPYQVQKSRLVERIAELITGRKLAALADVRDESAEDIRLVLEPRSRNVDPAVLMETLFRQTDLETRFSLNMNVLDGGLEPRVMTLVEVLQAFLDHRHEVLLRRTRHRLDRIVKRLEVLNGYLIAYANLDEIIRIIREEDDPKAEFIARWGMSEVQAEAILNMRLRALRKLEEVEIRKEVAGLEAEQTDLQALLDQPDRRRAFLGDELADIKRQFGPDTELGRRRTEIAGPPAAVTITDEALIDKEPITVVVSEKGWVRGMRGHNVDPAEVRYKEGDGPGFAIAAQTTDKLLVLASEGRVYTLGCDKLPAGRGHGEPLRLSIDLPNDQDVVDIRVHRPGARLLLAASDGRGFLAREDDLIAQTKAGKAVMSPGKGAVLKRVRPADGDHVAVIGDNRKLLVFPLDEVPELARGRGVKLQSYRDGGLADLVVFRIADGLSWKLGERTRIETDLTAWLGRRGGAGKLPPRGFPRNNQFD